MRLKDKVAIVTGGGSGFGAGIARRFAAEGAKLVVNDINAEGGARIAREVGGEFVQADVAKGADWAKLVQAASAKFGLPCSEMNSASTSETPAIRLTTARGICPLPPRSAKLMERRLQPSSSKKQSAGSNARCAITAGAAAKSGESTNAATQVRSTTLPFSKRAMCVSPTM